MSPTLSDLPFDLIDAIATLGDIATYVNLSRVCWRLQRLLHNDLTARRCLEQSIPFSSDCGKPPRNSKTNSLQTLVHIYQRDVALRTGEPYSLCTIAYGSTFFYDQGVLCYTSGGALRIHDTRDKDGTGCRTERVISSQAFLGLLAPSRDAAGLRNGHLQLMILNYADHIVALLVESSFLQESYLLAIDVRDCGKKPENTLGNHSRNRFLLCVPLSNTTKLFVRHNSLYLYYGSLSARGSDHHSEWLIQGYDLTAVPPREFSKKPLQLSRFFGSEVATSCAFAIHNNQFHAVSNQSSYESEEIDWTSYYQCIQFSVYDPNPDLTIRTLYRRQHREGPINDAWTDISLQVDVQTDRLLIIECRKEWLCGSSDSIRTYYTTPFHLPDAESESLQLGTCKTHPPNSQLALTIDERSNSRWEPEQPRIEKHTHRDGRAFEFMRSKTKWSTYHAANNCFIDLVSANLSVSGKARPKEQIMLRVAGRLRTSPLVVDHSPDSQWHHLGHRTWDPLILRDKLKDRDGDEIDGNEESFSETQVHLWPHNDNTSDEVLDILCPNGRAGPVTAMSDENGIAYAVGAPDANGDQAIVYISFDPGFGFEGLKILNSARTSAESASVAKEPGNLPQSPQTIVRRHSNGKDEPDPAQGLKRACPDQAPSSIQPRTSRRKRDQTEEDDNDIEIVSTDTCTATASASSELESESMHHHQPLFRKEDAMCLSIRRGFLFR